MTQEAGKSTEQILKKHLGYGHEEIEVSFHPRDLELIQAAMEEYAELVAFDFQKFRKKKLGFAFSDERLKADFEEYKKTL